MQEYEVYTCIDDEEVKCSAAVRICNTCEYRELFKCRKAIVKVEEEAGPCDYCNSIKISTPASPRHKYKYCPMCGKRRVEDEK